MTLGLWCISINITRNRNQELERNILPITYSHIDLLVAKAPETVPIIPGQLSNEDPAEIQSCASCLRESCL